MKFFDAMKIFWGVLTDSPLGKNVLKALQETHSSAPESVAKPENPQVAQPIAAQTSDRSAAIELLAALQRDARFVDFVKEDLTAYGDAEIGAVARNVHDACAATLERFFEIRRVVEIPEGEKIEISAKTASNEARYRLSSAAQGDQVAGTVVHAGWIAKKTSIPQWRGAPEDALVLAPVEIDV